MRVAEQRRGEAEPAVHTDRHRADALVTERGEADSLEQLVGPGGGHPRGGAEHTELATGGTSGVTGYVSEEHSHLTGGVRDAVQRSAAEVGDPPPRFDVEHQAKGHGLAGAGGTEERGDGARPGFESEVVDGGRKPAVGSAGESDGLEHRFSRGR